MAAPLRALQLLHSNKQLKPHKFAFTTITMGRKNSNKNATPAAQEQQQKSVPEKKAAVQQASKPQKQQKGQKQQPAVKNEPKPKGKTGLREVK